MNREHIAKVRDALKVLAETGKSPVEGIDAFDMDYELHCTDCGAAGCLIGWSAAVRLCLDGPLIKPAYIAFGMSDMQAKALFYPEGAAIRTRNPAHGVAILDWLLTQPDDVSPDAIAAKWAEVAP